MIYIGNDEVVQARCTDCSPQIKLGALADITPTAEEGPLLWGRPRANVIPMYFQSESPVSLVVTDPDGFTISVSTRYVGETEAVRAVPGHMYYATVGVDAAGHTKDRVSVLSPKDGLYIVKAVPTPGALATDQYSLNLVFHDNVTFTRFRRIVQSHTD